jgi:hypothetical protein
MFFNEVPNLFTSGCDLLTSVESNNFSKDPAAFMLVNEGCGPDTKALRLIMRILLASLIRLYYLLSGYITPCGIYI